MVQEVCKNKHLGKLSLSHLAGRHNSCPTFWCFRLNLGEAPMHGSSGDSREQRPSSFKLSSRTQIEQTRCLPATGSMEVSITYLCGSKHPIRPQKSFQWLMIPSPRPIAMLSLLAGGSSLLRCQYLIRRRFRKAEMCAGLGGLL
jgi:hypothetical protein